MSFVQPIIPYSEPAMRLAIFLIFAMVMSTKAAEPINVWPDFAPGETTKMRGELLPFRENETPPISRVVKISQPTLAPYPAENPNGTIVVILPGGGFGKVVPDMEGSEYAVQLNKVGISALVLNYRTKNDPSHVGWKRPLQDAQRAMSWVRSNAAEWKADPKRVGLVGFSAGGQVAARLLTDGGKKSYTAVDDTDQTSHRPDFAILIYPWNMYDKASGELISEINVTAETPTTFIVHTDDDASSSLGSVLFYAGLKKHGVSAELHVYQTGGHGYGTRDRKNSDIGTWPARSMEWLLQRKLAN